MQPRRKGVFLDGRPEQGTPQFRHEPPALPELGYSFRPTTLLEIMA